MLESGDGLFFEGFSRLGRGWSEWRIQCRRDRQDGVLDFIEEGFAGGKAAPSTGEEEDKFVAGASGNGAADEEGLADGGGPGLAVAAEGSESLADTEQVENKEHAEEGRLGGEKLLQTE